MGGRSGFAERWFGVSAMLPVCWADGDFERGHIHFWGMADIGSALTAGHFGKTERRPAPK
jgi:hypothetical protein